MPIERYNSLWTGQLTWFSFTVNLLIGLAILGRRYSHPPNESPQEKSAEDEDSLNVDASRVFLNSKEEIEEVKGLDPMNLKQKNIL